MNELPSWLSEQWFQVFLQAMISPLVLVNSYLNWSEDGNLLDLYAAWEEHVHELAVGRPSAQLLDLGKLGLKET